MAGTATNPPPAAGGNTPPNPAYSPAFLNSFRIAAVAERLESHIRNPTKIEALEFCNLCLSLARGLDYAAANNHIPTRIQELPILLKHLCKLNNDYMVQSAVMVLMISVKNACRNGWFRPTDCEELLKLANEVGNRFCSVKNMNTEASNSQQAISTVISRYYPRMKIGQTLVSLEAKPGYGTFAVDFFIEKNTKPKEKICLFVVQTDNLDTSSCIISPQQVNFLLNGKGVDRRTNVFMDPGPQLPTVVTSMLKYGTNLLQAVGQFKGNCVIVVAFTSVDSNLERPALQDCDPPTIAALSGSDSDIIEGPSRISLNCPISFRRIKTPVKGHLCKHLQCFDYDNFVDINSRRPSWRCPHCNQTVCYLDIRVDQNLVKVLKEVDDSVSDVIISADGSWKAVVESNERKDQPHDDKTPNSLQDMQIQDIPPNAPNPQDICDLTRDDAMEIERTYEAQDEKPNLAHLQSQSSVPPSAMHVNSATGEANQNPPHVEDDFWMGVYLSSYEGGGYTARPDARVIGHSSGFDPTNSMLPVLTDAVSPTLTQIPETSRGPSPSGFHLQLSEYDTISNEYGRFPATTRHVTRTPVAVQALPAQASTPHSSRNSFNTSMAQGASQVLSLPSISDGFNTTTSLTDRQHHLLRAQYDHLFDSSSMALPSPHQPSTAQDNMPYMPSQTVQQMAGLSTPSHLRNSYRTPTAVTTEQQHSRQQQQSLNIRLPHQVRSQMASNQVAQGGTHGIRHTGLPGHNNQQLVASQRAAQMTRQSPSVALPVHSTGQLLGNQRVNSGVAPPQAAATRTDASPNSPAEQNWRPTGRMRGSLSGRAYSEALSQFLLPPTQPAHAAPRPALNITSPPPGLPPPIRALLANNRNILIPPPVANLPQTDSALLPQTQPALPPQTQPGLGPQTQPGLPPQTQPMMPKIQLALPPQTQPAMPQTQPVLSPQTHPAMPKTQPALPPPTQLAMPQTQPVLPPQTLPEMPPNQPAPPQTQPASMTGSSGVLPEGTSGM